VGRAMTTVEKPHPSLSHRCPFCSAEPGQPCRAHRGRGRELGWPHSRRLQLADPLPASQPKPPVNALCCECGNLRTVSAAYCFRRGDPNRSTDGFGDHPRGWRYTGTLLCSTCGRRTRHAVLRSDQYRDSAETWQRYALGGQWEGKYPPDRNRLREAYFKQFPRNPKLWHRFETAEADRLRAEGQTHMSAVCGAVAEIPRSWKKKTPDGELLKPDRIDWDTEFEDPDTGMWWVDMQCVDCLRVANERRRKRSREQLAELISWYFVHAGRLNDDEVSEVRRCLEDAGDRAYQRWLKDRQRSQK
jgi:hypothetical protein